MMNITRHHYTNQCIIGKLEIGDYTCYTLELPWRNNKRNISCIPPRKYKCRQRRYNKGGYQAIELVDVPDRSHIMIHKGNFPNDVKGCVCVGTVVDYNRPAVFNSKVAFDLLMEYFEDLSEEQQVYCEVTDYSPLASK